MCVASRLFALTNYRPFIANERSPWRNRFHRIVYDMKTTIFGIWNKYFQNDSARLSKRSSQTTITAVSVQKYSAIPIFSSGIYRRLHTSHNIQNHFEFLAKTGKRVLCVSVPNMIEQIIMRGTTS